VLTDVKDMLEFIKNGGFDVIMHPFDPEARKRSIDAANEMRHERHERMTPEERAREHEEEEKAKAAAEAARAAAEATRKQMEDRMEHLRKGAPPQYFSGGGGDDMFAGWPESSNIEDRRDEDDRGKYMKENTAELKRLNDFLVGAAPGGGGGGVGGYGFLSGGAGGGGGFGGGVAAAAARIGPGGAGAINIPSMGRRGPTDEADPAATRSGAGGDIKVNSATDEAIRSTAAQAGMDPAHWKAIADLESSLDPSSNMNKKTQYKGLFQVNQEEMQKAGGGNIYDAHDNATAAAAAAKRNNAIFKKRFGRDPDAGETYLMHQQGPGFYTRGTMTNIGGNMPPSLRGRDPKTVTHDEFEAGWKADVERRTKKFSTGTGEATGSSVPTAGSAGESNMEFLRSRGGHDARDSNEPGGIHPEMAARLAAAGRAYEAATGKRANYGEMFRDRARQAKYYQNYISGGGGLAAFPGTSRHEQGQATDVPRGGFRDWLAGGNADPYGLEFLKGRAYQQDPVHVQMNRDYRGAPYAGRDQPGGASPVTPGGASPVTHDQIERARSVLNRNQSMKVEGSGKISVDVNAPKGTRVGAQGKGLFKDVEIKRQTQMEPAKRGPEAGEE
jgi:hypothetical protein